MLHDGHRVRRVGDQLQDSGGYVRRDGRADYLHGVLAMLLPVDGRRVREHLMLTLLAEVEGLRFPGLQLLVGWGVKQTLADAELEHGQVVTRAGELQDANAFAGRVTVELAILRNVIIALVEDEDEMPGSHFSCSGAMTGCWCWCEKIIWVDASFLSDPKLYAKEGSL